MEQLVARRAHNPKVVGSSPAPATVNKKCNGITISLHFSFHDPCNILILLLLEAFFGPSPFAFINPYVYR